MFGRFNEKMSMRAAVWLFPIIFLIHDAEELVFIESWSQSHQFGLFKIWMWTTPKMAVAISILFVLICLACYDATRKTRPNPRWFTVAVAILFLNVFTHTAQSILFWDYMPGVVTALVVLLPYTAYLLVRLEREGWIKKQTVRSLYVAAFALVIAASVVQIFS